MDLTNFEPFLTIKAAAKVIGVEYWRLLEGVNKGDIPTYRLSNTRRLVRASEIEAAMAAAGSRGAS